MVKSEILKILDDSGKRGSRSELLKKIGNLLKKVNEHNALDSDEDSRCVSYFDELCLLGLIKLGSNENGITWATTDFENTQIEFYRALTKKEKKSGLRFYSTVYGK